MLALSIDAASATDGLVTPAVGGAVLAAGYDRDFAALPPDGDAVEPVRVPSHEAVVLRGTAAPAHRARRARSERRRQGQDRRRRARARDRAAGSSAGGDLATTVPVSVGLPGGEVVTLRRGGLATSSVARRAGCAAGERQHHLIDPATGRPAQTPWQRRHRRRGLAARAPTSPRRRR